jgi:thiosulfate/3-mercaptopyruvate sulfurtransferase
MSSSFALARVARRSAMAFVIAAAAVFVVLSLGPSGRVAANQEKPPNQEKSVDPWGSAEILRPADFAQEFSQAKSVPAATIVYVGFRTLFEGGHVPGAVFHGTASADKGIAELKTYLRDLPRSTNLVIYCGCCPFDRCPNIRPAYKAAQEMGFTHIRVLVLPTSFAADWVGKGYPLAKGL